MPPRKLGLVSADPPKDGNRVRHQTGAHGKVQTVLTPGPSLTDPDDPRIPIEYRGRVWEYATGYGIVTTPFPPMEEGDALTEAFMAFQLQNGELEKWEHPEHFCGTCGWRRVGPNGACGPCLAEANPQPRLGSSRRRKAAPIQDGPGLFEEAA